MVFIFLFHFFTRNGEFWRAAGRALIPAWFCKSFKPLLQRALDFFEEKLELSKTMSSFLLLLFEKGRIGFIGSINDFYQMLADELKGVARASLVSASQLTSEAIEKIRSALSKKTGKDVILQVKHDPALIGGIVTRIGDLILDGSIKTQLLNMRESLRRGERA